MLRLPQRRIWRVAIYLGSLWLIVTAIDLVLVQMGRTIHPGYLTTRIEGPRIADGRIDYLRTIDDFFVRDVTLENNAAPFLLRAAGPDAVSPAQPANAVTARLGMQPLSPTGSYFVPFDAFSKGKSFVAETDLAEEVDSDTTWPVAIGPGMRAWIAANAQPLDLMVEGSKRPEFFIPLYAGYRPDTIAESYLKHVLPAIRMCHALLTRSLIRLEAGDAAGFRADVLAVHRWARLIAKSQTLVERAQALAIEATACRFDRLAAGSGKLSADELHALLADLQRLDELKPPLDSIDQCERYIVLDLVQWIAQGGPSRISFAVNIILDQAKVPPPFGVRIGAQFLPVDYDKCMERLNQFYDGALAGARQPTWQMRRDAMQEWEAEVNRIAKRNRLMSYLSSDWLPMMLLPSLTNVVVKTETSHAELRLTRIAVAVHIYKAEEGAFPKALDALAPKILPGIPDDPFADAEAQYRASENSFELYSVGPNIEGDRGKKDDINASFAVSSHATRPASGP
jgi:hypothetical protein